MLHFRGIQNNYGVLLFFRSFFETTLAHLTTIATSFAISRTPCEPRVVYNNRYFLAIIFHPFEEDL